MKDSDKVTYITDKLLEKGFVCDDYSEWINIGLELSDLGENGRESYHKIASTSAKYNYQDTDKKFDELIKNRSGRRSINSFFYRAIHEFGIRPKGNNVNSDPRNSESNKTKDNRAEEKWLFNAKDVREAEPEEVIWAYIVKGNNNGFVSSSEAGKTTLLVNLSLAIARGDKLFMDWRLNTTFNRVLYISTEDGISQLKKKLASFDKYKPLTDDDRLLFIFSTENIYKHLEYTLEKYPCDIVIFDPWGDLVGGDYGNEKTHVELEKIRIACNKYNATPIVVHHTNKASENIPEKGSIKGAGDFEQKCRVVMFLTVYNDSRWLCCTKGNPFSEREKRMAFEIKLSTDGSEVLRTGGEMSRASLSTALRKETFGRKAIGIDWESILTEPMKHNDLCQKIHEETGLAKSTARGRITNALEDQIISKDKNGLYVIIPRY